MRGFLAVDHDRTAVAVELEAFRDGKRVGIITSEKRTYVDLQRNPLFQPTTEVGIRSTAKLDTYVVLAGVRNRDTAELRVTFNPLVVWVWIGGFLMMIGGMVVMWPQAERRRTQGGYAAVMPPTPQAAELTASV